MSGSDTITVCAACLRASCWQGKFYCEDYKTADTVEMSPQALQLLGRECSSYWVVCDSCGTACGGACARRAAS